MQRGGREYVRRIAAQLNDVRVNCPVHRVTREGASLLVEHAAGSERFAKDPIEVGGMFSLLGLLKDPDINRSLSFFATVAKSVGQELAKPRPQSR